MKYFKGLTVLLLIAAGCKPGIPKELIQPDKMALVLHDIHIFDGYINSVTHTDTARMIAAGYYKGIYQKYGIDSALYNQSLTYYNNHPRIMEQIYKDVVERLKKEKKQYIRADSLEGVKRAKMLRAKARRDSIRHADSLKVISKKKSLKLDSLKKADSVKKQLSLKKKEALKRKQQRQKTASPESVKR